MRFTERAHAKYMAEWDKMLSHPFITELSQNKLDDSIFDFWAMQDYIFVREAIRFFSVLMARFPRKYQKPFQQTLAGLEHELEIFQEYAGKRGIDLDKVQPTPICHAYNSFLLASAYHEDVDTNFVILYTAEKAYHEAWKRVRAGLKKGTPYESFIENWAGDMFRQYVDWLGSELDSMTEGYPESRLAKLDEIFLLTVRYEYLFWEMAYNRLKWV
jgi:thiaminase/transcriptional activator TenA